MADKLVLMDHDGGVDDYLSTALLLTMEHLRVLGIVVTPADCYIEPAVGATRKLLDLMGRVGAAPERTRMIGDTTHDSRMAKNAGAHALSVTYGAHPHDELAVIEPEGIVHSVAELSAWLTQHG